MNLLDMLVGCDRETAADAVLASEVIRRKVPGAVVTLRPVDDRLVIEVVAPLVGDDRHVEQLRRVNGASRSLVIDGVVEVTCLSPDELWGTYADRLAEELAELRARYCSGEIVDGTTIHYTYEGTCPVHPDAPLLDGEPVTGTWDRTVGHTVWIYGETTDLGSDQYGNDVITPYRVNTVGTVESFDPVVGMRLGHSDTLMRSGPFSERQLQDLNVRMFP